MATASPKKSKSKKKGNNKHKKTVDSTTPALPVNDDGERFTFFFRTNSPFSQWHPAEFTVEGVEFNCAEQFMMYQKAKLFKDDDIAEQILQTSSPRDQKGLGRKVDNFNDTVWKKNCVEIVKNGNLAKFGQNQHLFDELKATHGTTLVEASPFDRIWGIGMGATNPKANNRNTWRGSNLLGEILTQVREELMSGGTPSVTVMSDCTPSVTVMSDCTPSVTVMSDCTPSVTVDTTQTTTNTESCPSQVTVDEKTRLSDDECDD